MQGLTSTSTVANPVPNPDQVLSPLVISTIGAHLTLTSLLPHPLPLLLAEGRLRATQREPARARLAQALLDLGDAQLLHRELPRHERRARVEQVEGEALSTPRAVRRSDV